MLSKLRIPALSLSLIGLLMGCGTPAATISAGGPAPQVTTAYFAERPDGMIGAVRTACRNPGVTFVQPRAGVVQCRMYLEPPATAAVILNYDGDIRNLPQLVFSLATARAGDGLCGDRHAPF